MRFGRLRLLGLLGFGSAICLAVGAMGSWPGCAVYNSSLLLSADAGPGEGGRVDSGTCVRAIYPAIPAASDASSGMDPYKMVAAMQSLDVGVGVSVADGGVVVGPLPKGMTPLPPLGWDLDNVCTCPGAPSCVTTNKNCDDGEGRDNTGLKLFRTLGASAQMSNAAADEALMGGQYGLLVTMTNYNGMPDDDRVTVALYFSSGVPGTGDGGVTLAHDGSDKWTVDPRSIAGGTAAGPQLIGVDCDNNNSQCQPSYVDDSAYVASNVLVASLGDVPITFGGRANLGGAVMDLSQTILVGRLVPVSLTSGSGGVGWGIADGSVSGRWGSTKLLTNMATIPDPTSDAGAFLCGQNSLTYQALKRYICSLEDISLAGKDNQGAPCDAISMAFGFTAEPARLGLVAPLPNVESGCATGGVPFFDTCPQ